MTGTEWWPLPFSFTQVWGSYSALLFDPLPQFDMHTTKAVIFPLLIIAYKLILGGTIDTPSELCMGLPRKL